MESYNQAQAYYFDQRGLMNCIVQLNVQEQVCKSLLKFPKADFCFTVTDGSLKIEYKLFSGELFGINFTNVNFQLIDFLDLKGSGRFKE